jgi:hypothetical protein
MKERTIGRNPFFLRVSPDAKIGSAPEMHAMHEKRSPEKNSPTAVLEKFPTEILVARGRSFEPFVKTFIYSGENISSLDLGTLVGVFEVDERSEDSAYIVNFLASVAKKEYFGNPRRGAIESFEAALHKVNLALAELVKHGNVAWLGSFHGVIGAFEKGGMHFSATGQGSILLLRNDTLTDIGEGLASDEASAHPIKTFIEISSGRLLAGDRIIFSSPELLRLFSQEDLLKNALRMDAGRFDQFLKTALVNELDMAGTIVMHIKEGSQAPKKTPEEEKREPAKAASTIENVFSQSAFSKKAATQEAEKEDVLTTDEPQSEYIDSKTGHIYVQGNDPVEPTAHPALEHISLFFQELGGSLRTSVGTQSKWFRKMKKQSAIAMAESIESAHGAVDRMTASLKRRLAERRRIQKEAREAAIKKEEAEETKQPTIAPATKTFTPPLDAPRPAERPTPAPIVPPAPAEPTPVPEEVEIPLFIREKLAAFYKKEHDQSAAPEPTVIEIRETRTLNIAPISEKAILVLSSTLRSIRPIALSASSITTKQTGRLFRGIQKTARRTGSIISTLPPRRRLIILGSFVALLGGAAAYAWLSPDTPEQVSAPEAAPAETADAPAYSEEKNARQIGTLSTLSQRGNISDVVALHGQAYIISSQSIFDISENRDYPLPSNSGRIILSTPMDDLRLVFLYTDQGKLFAWSPISRTFAENTLSLPQGSQIQGIGTYLTYLYALDRSNGQIYRFPRADGGFGAPTSWLRESLTTDERARIAVSESIFASPDGSSVKSFFRGRLVKDFELPSAPLSVTSITSRSDASFVYALDATQGRIIAWDKDGAIAAQYFSEQLRNARSITWNEEEGNLLIATEDTLFSLKP